jgi:hypothetical protein
LRNNQSISELQKELLNLRIEITQQQAALSYHNEYHQKVINMTNDMIQLNGVSNNENNSSDNVDTLMICTKEELINIIYEIKKYCNEIILEKNELKKFINDATSMRIQYTDLSNSYKELQEAHVEQSRYIQKMQKQNSKVRIY